MADYNPFLEALYGQDQSDMQKMAQVGMITKLAEELGEPLDDEQIEELQEMPDEDLDELTQNLAAGVEALSDGYEEDEITPADLMGLSEEDLAELGHDKQSSVDLMMADQMGRNALHAYLMEKEAAGVGKVLQTSLLSKADVLDKLKRLAHAPRGVARRYSQLMRGGRARELDKQLRAAEEAALRAPRATKELRGRAENLRNMTKSEARKVLAARLLTGAGVVGAGGGLAYGLGREKKSAAEMFEEAVQVRAQELAGYLDKTAGANDIAADIDLHALSMLEDAGYDISPLIED